MDQSVCCRYRHCFIHEDTAPGAERMVTRDDEASSFVPVGDKLEQMPGRFVPVINLLYVIETDFRGEHLAERSMLQAYYVHAWSR